MMRGGSPFLRSLRRSSGYDMTLAAGCRTVLVFLRHPVFLRLTAFLISFAALDQLLGPTRCADGWRSPSIGRSGACSHHSGVDRQRRGIRFYGSLAIALLVWGGLSRRMNSDPPRSGGYT